ncbi:OmpA family protein [Burkholderia pseudomallei]|uniref:OmpA family protein n=1 Tax=Burkholderia pseudomallei TaxID=28450 RepID=UPI0005381BCE|nr:OmpA family protein [Burkholderia pseudomallei]KGX18110.1 ompA family protein [Burkholderia pseudomallei ABCPW 1]
MKRMFMAGAAVVVFASSLPTLASVASEADALVPAAHAIADPYTRGLALGWLEIAARQDREVLVSRPHKDAALKALRNARHFIDGSVPFTSIFGAKQWPATDRPDWSTALQEIERVDQRASQSPCKGEDAGRLTVLTDEVWKEQDETHGTRWVHGWAQIERARKLAQQVDRELDACRPATPVPESVALSADALFAFDSAELTPEGQSAISELAGRVKALPLYRLTVTGYTDRIGTDAYNLTLSQRRAEAVARALTTAGVVAGRVETHGLGKAAPIADCPGPVSDEVIACLAPNRRVTISADAMSPEDLDQLNAVMRGLNSSPGPGIPVY